MLWGDARYAVPKVSMSHLWEDEEHTRRVGSLPLGSPARVWRRSRSDFRSVQVCSDGSYPDL
jgi:hypothetical protein